MQGNEQQALYTGRAGEYLVAAQLLRLGWNASIVPVDTGIDILAHRTSMSGEPELLQCQVKTTQRNTYSVSLPSANLKQMWREAVNLIVLFWKIPNAADDLVIPPRLIGMLTSGGYKCPEAPFDVRGEAVSLKFFHYEGRFFIRNRSNDITPMLNRYDLVEATDIDTDTLPKYASWSSDQKTLVRFHFEDWNTV